MEGNHKANDDMPAADDGKCGIFHDCSCKLLADSNVHKLEIGFDGILPHKGDWQLFGRGIGANGNLKELKFYDLDDEVIKSDFADIFHGINSNRSISRISFRGCGLLDSDLFSTLTPFFKSNHNFRSLAIRGCELGSGGLRLLSKALSEFNSLIEFELSQGELGDLDSVSCIQALTGHAGLRKIVLRDCPIGWNGCLVLASMIQYPNIQLDVLNLANCKLDDNSAVILSRGLSKNGTLRELNLGHNPNITGRGWAAIFPALQCNQKCRLEKLVLRDNLINDYAALLLANTLASNMTLKSLDLSCCRYFVGVGWRALFDILRTPFCRLEELKLKNNGFGDNLTFALSFSLVSNRSLRRLAFSENPLISINGWWSLSIALLSPNSVLEDLCLSSSGINDEAMKSISSALVTNRSLRSLDLSGNSEITTRGWQAFSAVLNSPCSALESLDVSGNPLNDGTIVALTSPLANNTRLVELLTDGFNWNVSSHGWSALSQILCNKTSIIDTYQSNHTLQKLCQKNMAIVLKKDVDSLLEVNREHSKSQAAALKIIKTHFSGSCINLRPFIDMKLNVYPYALAWIARYAKCSDWANGFSLLYQFVQNIHSCFDSGGGGAPSQDVPEAKRRKI